MGCGKNGTFDIHPDFNQWAIMVFFKTDVVGTDDQIKEPTQILGKFIPFWWNLFTTNMRWFLLEAYAGHGSWDGKVFIDNRKEVEEPIGKIGVLTRATIRLSRLKEFWEAVPKVAQDMDKNKGFLYSVGIGEIPFIKQATFSMWESSEDMKSFAYKKKDHQEVIQKTRKNQWYTEEMFLRFKILVQKNS
jgi:hypothetical protein